MADIASTDVTITPQETSGAAGKSWIIGGKRYAEVKIQFGNDTLTYPAGGVPMPGFAKFNMQRNLDYLVLHDTDDASGVVWKYDRDNKKIRGYLQGVTVAAQASATMDDYALNTTADTLASTMSVGLNTSLGAGTYFYGKLKEIVNTQAPSATVIYATAVGW